MSIFPPPVRVIVPTTGGPAEIIYLGREDASVGQSMVCINGTTQQAGIDQEYNAFVRRPSGLIEELYAHGTFRMDVDGPIDVGSSWQLGTFLAHALEAEDSLLQRLDAPDERERTLVWATGAVRTVDMAVGEVGHVADKVRLSLDLLQKAASGGVECVLLLPAGNLKDIDPDSSAKLAALGVRIEAVRNLTDALDLLDIPVPDRRKPLHPRQAADAEEHSSPRWTGNPYPGLQAFGREERAVFFGRGRAREECLELLRRAAARGRPFLLVHGKSGAGKSSLAMAGIAGDVAMHAYEGGEWRVAVARLTGSDKDSTEEITSAIAETLTLDGSARHDFLRSFADDPHAAVTARCASVASAKPVTKILLVLDQLEQALVGDETYNDPARFGEMLERLCIGGSVWVVATMRTDQLDLLERSPALSRLAADERLYRLQPPSLYELSEIITQPALLAGLSFGEKDAGLPDELAEMALRSPDSLPLLQFVLSRLAELAGPERILSRTVLDRIGGFDGAVVTGAEEAVSELAAQGYTGVEVDRVLSEFVRSDETGEHFLSREVAIRDTDGPADRRRHIIDHLVAARLIVADSRNDVFSAKLAHESLVRTWPRLSELVNRHAGNIVLRDRLETGAREWIAGDLDSSLLLRGDARILAAEELCADNRLELGTDVVRYVAHSRDAQKAERQRIEDEQTARLQAAAEKERLAKRLLRRTVAGVAAAAILAGVSVWFAVSASDNLREARSSMSLLFGMLASERVENRPVEAIKLALGAAQITPDANGPSQTFIDHALTTAMKQPRAISVVQGQTLLRGSFAAFSPDRARILTIMNFKTAALWSVHTGEMIATLPHNDAITSLAFSSKDGNPITVSRDGEVKIWSRGEPGQLLTRFTTSTEAKVEEGTILETSDLEATHLGELTLSRDGSRLVTVNLADAATIWDVRDQTKIATVDLSKAGGFSVELSPAGDYLVNRNAEVWPLSRNGTVSSHRSPEISGEVFGIGEHALYTLSALGEVVEIPYDSNKSPIVHDVLDAPEGRPIRLQVTTSGHYLIVSDTGAVIIGDFTGRAPGRKLTVHGLSDAVMAETGELLALKMRDNTVRIVDTGDSTDQFDELLRIDNGQLLTVTAAAGIALVEGPDIPDQLPGRPPGEIIDARFSPDGDRLTLLIRNAEEDVQLAVYSVQDGVSHAEGVRPVTFLGEHERRRMRLSTDGSYLIETSYGASPPEGTPEAAPGTVIVRPVEAPDTVAFSYQLDTAGGEAWVAGVEPDERRVALTGSFAGVRLRYADGEKSRLLTLSGFPDEVIFTPDRKFLIAVHDRASLVVHDLRNLTVVGQLQLTAPLHQLVMAPDRPDITVTLKDGTIASWRPAFLMKNQEQAACFFLPRIRGKRDTDTTIPLMGGIGMKLGNLDICAEAFAEWEN